jgi:hypothetical protein
MTEQWHPLHPRYASFVLERRLSEYIMDPQTVLGNHNTNEIGW